MDKLVATNATEARKCCHKSKNLPFEAYSFVIGLDGKNHIDAVYFLMFDTMYPTDEQMENGYVWELAVEDYRNTFDMTRIDTTRKD